MSNFFDKSDLARKDAENIVSDTLKNCDDGELEKSHVFITAFHFSRRGIVDEQEVAVAARGLPFRWTMGSTSNPSQQ